MNELDNQELLKRPLVEELIPTTFDEKTAEPIYSSTSETLAILSPDEAGTVLSIGSFAGLPETTVTVPITISDAEGLQSLQVSLSYNPEILSIVDPNGDTDENEAVRRAGLSEGWELEPTNPVANVDGETGEVNISLVNTGELPEADEDGNVPSGTILEIDFTVNEGAELDSVTNIDLQSAGIGVNDEEIVFGDENLDDGDLTVAESVGGATVELFRFRNTEFNTGTYLFVGESERDDILNDPGFSETFELEGEQEDGSVIPAFTVSLEPGDDLIPFYRIQSIDTPGTYLFVGENEYNNIFAEDSDQRDKWTPEGLNLETGEDVADYYLLDNDVDRGTQFNRFQNTQNGTFLYAGPPETQDIENNPLFDDVFDNQGDAFESL